ncbi:hypothetical protein HYH02_012389 [Chlamydomonas schloesseri]|uniref:Uncharacterized protein n=1 Tax=Chlamydomonas schloesseri TaxID=2026947 RepID=A0A835T5T1_9CHLO|nr:hypothetical protein HYH02_012389 [Chlamydomonas schloesseri]|eukprot:KAG2434374.1 hypothetical protein HYH02_012389 [Chlamydomonas schloesseri]
MGNKQSAEAEGVTCASCQGALPPNNYAFEHILGQLFVFYEDHPPQERFAFDFRDSTTSIQGALGELVTVSKTVQYFRGDAEPYAYYCPACFVLEASPRQRQLANRLCSPGGTPVMGLWSEGLAGAPPGAAAQQAAAGHASPHNHAAGNGNHTGERAAGGGSDSRSGSGSGIRADYAAAIAASRSGGAVTASGGGRAGGGLDEEEEDAADVLTAPEFEAGFYYHTGERVMWGGHEYVCRRSHEGRAGGPLQPVMLPARSVKEQELGAQQVQPGPVVFSPEVCWVRVQGPKPAAAGSQAAAVSGGGGHRLLGQGQGQGQGQGHHAPHTPRLPQSVAAIDDVPVADDNM